MTFVSFVTPTFPLASCARKRDQHLSCVHVPRDPARPTFVTFVSFVVPILPLVNCARKRDEQLSCVRTETPGLENYFTRIGTTRDGHVFGFYMLVVWSSPRLCSRD